MFDGFIFANINYVSFLNGVCMPFLINLSPLFRSLGGMITQLMPVSLSLPN